MTYPSSVRLRDFHCITHLVNHANLYHGHVFVRPIPVVAGIQNGEEIV